MANEYNNGRVPENQMAHKYLSFTQLTINFEGNRDRILIVKDISPIIYLRKILDVRK